MVWLRIYQSLRIWERKQTGYQIFKNSRERKTPKLFFIHGAGGSGPCCFCWALSSLIKSGRLSIIQDLAQAFWRLQKLRLSSAERFLLCQMCICRLLPAAEWPLLRSGLNEGDQMQWSQQGNKVGKHKEWALCCGWRWWGLSSTCDYWQGVTQEGDLLSRHK